MGAKREVSVRRGVEAVPHMIDSATATPHVVHASGGDRSMEVQQAWLLSDVAEAVRAAG